MTGLTFRCAGCGLEFPFVEAADAAAHAEAERNFGQRGDAPGMAIVCDDCYRGVMSSLGS